MTDTIATGAPTPAVDPTRTVSPSKLDTWTRCQWQWYARYVLGLRQPPSASLAWGRAYDRAANDTYREKMARGDTPPLRDTLDRYAASWDDERRQVEDWRDEEKPGDLLDAGVDLTRKWHRNAARFVAPVAIQQPMRRTVVTAVDSFEVNGYADAVAQLPDGPEQVIIDHKAGRKSYGAADLFHSTQALAYAFAGGQRRFSLHVGRRNAKGTGASFHIVTRSVTEGDAASFAQSAAIARRQMQHALASGDFLPNRSHQLCSRRWCGYWRECEKANGGRVAP